MSSQELAIWKEQRDDAKQRKGGGRSLGEEGGGTAAGGASPGGTSNTAGPREEQAVGQEGSDKPAAPAEVCLLWCTVRWNVFTVTCDFNSAIMVYHVPGVTWCMFA